MRRMKKNNLRALTVLSAAKSVILLLVMAQTGVSCRREPIHEPFSSYYLRLNNSYEALHITPSRPGMFEAVFYDRETHEEVGQSYLGTNGGYLYDIAPGTYEMIVYQFDGGNTELTGFRRYCDAKAYTSPWPDGDTVAYNAPDHLLADRDTAFTIPFLYDTDETYYLDAYPSTVTDTWCVVIDGIKGLRNAASMDMYVSGQSRSTLVASLTDSKEEMNIHVPVQVDYENDCIRTPFCTFGKLAGRKSRLRLVITDQNQQTYVCRAEITDQFDDPENTGHWIYLHFDITIEPKKSGGMMPVVNEWEENVYDFDLF